MTATTKEQEWCPRCAGTGRLWFSREDDAQCAECDGTGYVSEPHDEEDDAKASNQAN